MFGFSYIWYWDDFLCQIPGISLKSRRGGVIFICSSNVGSGNHINWRKLMERKASIYPYIYMYDLSEYLILKVTSVFTDRKENVTIKPA